MKTRHAAAAGLAAVLGLFASPAAAVEEPAFRVLLTDGGFEVRDYPSLVVAEVTVTGSQRQAANAGFRILAGYIFGGNRSRQVQVAPGAVSKAPASERIAMTAPVTQVQSGETWTVRFTMPSRYSLDTLPQPNDPRVTLRQAPAERLAVLRFSGVARSDVVSAKSATLLAAAASHHLSPRGDVALAQYDPPWTPGFLRRNEVMVSVDR